MSADKNANEADTAQSKTLATTAPELGAIGLTELDPGTVAPTGKLQAFRDVRRQLTDEDLASPGVQKLILQMLEQAELDKERLRDFEDRFHEADKRAAVLTEKLQEQTAYEILYTVAFGIGFALVGLAPSLWDVKSSGHYILIAGFVLVVSAIAAKVYRRK